MIEILAIAASLFTGSTCAAIDNTANTAAWAGPDTPSVQTTYSDHGRFLMYDDAPGPTDTDAWVALHTAEAALVEGAPGPKVEVRCSSLPLV